MSRTLYNTQASYIMPDINKTPLLPVADLLTQINDLRLKKADSEGNWHNWLQSIGRTDLETRLTPKNPMSYSSAEYMLPGLAAEGGLGALSRDHYLQAVLLGIPAHFFGLLYKEQKIQTLETDDSGNFWQKIHMENLPTPEELHFKHLHSLNVAIYGEYGLDSIPVYLHPLSTTKTPLYLLQVEGGVYPKENNSNDRLWNNIVLGFGQHQINTQLKERKVIDDIAFYHTNESAMVISVLAALDDATLHHGDTLEAYDKSLAEIRTKDILTNHTLVPAAEATFSRDQCETFILSNLKSRQMKKQLTEFIAHHDGQLKLLDLALYLAGTRNGVSEDHSRIAAGVFHLDFHAVTNGIYEEDWAGDIVNILRRYNVIDRFGLPSMNYTEHIEEIPTEILVKSKQTKIEAFRQFLLAGGRRDQFGNIVKLPENPLIIGDARRFAGYKRRTIAFSYFDVFRDILEHYPNAHIFISGKAHRHDLMPIADLSRILKSIAHNKVFRDQIHFLPNWEPKFAKILIGASHVWVNNPRVGFEACGTSGMKAGLNLALLVSTKDGFLAEVPQSAFYAINGESDSAEELASYYAKLTQAIADAHNSEDWATNVKRLWKSNFLHITSGARMLAQYLDMALPQQKEDIKIL